MKSSSELTDFYYDTLYPTLTELEQQRKVVASRAIKIFYLIAGVTLLLIYLLYNQTHQLNGISFFLAFGGFIAANWFYRYSIKDYRTDFKFRVIEPLIKEIDTDLNYSPEAKLSQQLFERSGLFQKDIDYYDGNDLVRGSIEGVNLEFSDLHVKHKSSETKGNQHDNTIFKGLYIVCEFNKHFKSRTIILPDHAEKYLGSFIGRWFQSKNFSRDDLIKLEDNHFEKEFVVYGSDQIESRYILTHSMMQKLLAFKKRVKQNISIAFVDANIHIAIEYNKDLFEPNVFESLLDYKSLMSYINSLQAAVGIVQELKLNERLWSKV
jgi:hypothetical protein